MESEKPIFKESMMESAKTATSGGNIPASFRVLDVGGNDGLVAREKYPDAEIEVIDLKHGWDIEVFGIPSGPWNVILANHFLEHYRDPDQFLEMCKKAMTKNTVLEIAMPNMSSWYNRIFFLFGFLPQSYEISYRKIYGRAIKDGTGPGGHIRLMNIPSTIELLKDHGLTIKDVSVEVSNRTGFVSYLDHLITILNPKLASAFRVKCTL